MIISFTGTQDGMNVTQKTNVIKLIKAQKAKITKAVHGDCIGADTDFHNIMSDIFVMNDLIEIHPCTATSKRAYNKAPKIYEPIAPLDRNRIMVQRAHLVIGTPGTDSEILRSGTWMSIRYAKKMVRPLVIFYPGGAIEAFNMEKLQK